MKGTTSKELNPGSAHEDLKSPLCERNKNRCGVIPENKDGLIPRGYTLVYGQHITENFSFLGREFKKGDVLLHLRPDNPELP